MTCDCGKVRYRSRKEARHARAVAPRRKGKLRVYQCPAGFWHLTSADALETAWFRRMRANA